jgi:hypothetical protein
VEPGGGGLGLALEVGKTIFQRNITKWLSGFGSFC